MIFQPEAYYVIQDTSDRSRKLTVIVESDSRLEIERYQRDHGFSECEIYKEQGQELYRLICQAREIKSDSPY